MLGLLGLLEGVLCFLALLEGGLNHGVPHARRSERSADYTVFFANLFQEFTIINIQKHAIHFPMFFPINHGGGDRYVEGDLLTFG